MTDIIAVFMFWLVAFLGLGLAGGWIFAWVNRRFIEPWRWPYIVLVREKRQHGMFPFFDRAKVWEDPKSGIVKLRLKKMRRDIRPVKYGSIISYGTGGFIDLYSPNRDEYFITKFITDKMLVKHMLKDAEGKDLGKWEEVEVDAPKVNIIPDDDKAWYNLAHEEKKILWADKKGIMEKYGTFISVGFIAMLMIVSVVLWLQYMPQTIAAASSGLVGVSENLDQVSDRLERVIVLLGGEINETIDVPPDTPPPPKEGINILNPLA